MRCEIKHTYLFTYKLFGHPDAFCKALARVFTVAIKCAPSSHWTFTFLDVCYTIDLNPWHFNPTGRAYKFVNIDRT